MEHYLSAFLALFVWRYLRLVVNFFAAWSFKPIPLPANPTYSKKDVTVIIPTLANDENFSRCLLSIDACNPAAIIIVTPKPEVEKVQKICKELNLPDVKILGAKQANKRLQMIQGLKKVKTSITFFADDDVFWVPTFLEYNLATFEDPNVGAVGGLQSLERPAKLNYWDFLSAIYLERRHFEVSATYTIDGGISCLSGRTCGIRSEIIQNQNFIDEFENEKWLGCVDLVAADDDNFVTRYLVNLGWKIAVQFHDGAGLTTTLENNPKFLQQCIRWRRTTWRSNLTSLVFDRVIWRDQPYSTYAMHLSSFNPPAMVMDPLLGYLLYRAVQAASPDSFFPSMTTTMALFVFWVFFTKTIKFVRYFSRYPADLKFLPVLYAFAYLHGFIYWYTLFTLHRTTWGGGRSAIVSDYEKRGVGAFISSSVEAGISGLKRVGSSGSSLNLLGGDKTRKLSRPLSTNASEKTPSW